MTDKTKLLKMIESLKLDSVDKRQRQETSSGTNEQSPVWYYFKVVPQK